MLFLLFVVKIRILLLKIRPFIRHLISSFIITKYKILTYDMNETANNSR